MTANSARSLPVPSPSFGEATALGSLQAGAITLRLDAARQAVESRFLAAGDILSQAVDGVGELIASLDRLTESLSPETVRTTTSDLQSAAASLLALPANHADRRGRIVGLVKLGGGLDGCIDEMRQHLAYLRVFAINIKITSGGIAAAGPEFAIFAQEICDCIELGCAELEGFNSALMALDGALRAALAHELRLSRHCADLLPAVPDGLTASVAKIAAHHERLSGVALSVASLARSVQKKVGGVLAAMQIGDITRQRIEHVQAGLELAQRSDAVAALDDEQRGRLATFLHGLLAAQLAATAEDFQRDVARIGQNMAGMAADASEILRLRDLAHGRDAGDSDGFLRGLESNVGQALGLVEKMDAAERTAEEVGRSAGAAARDLTARIAGIQTIRADVQMMALNTTLKCSRIGDTGRPLDVIAVELRRYAGHLEKSADQTVTALDALSAEASVLGRGTEDGLAAGAGAGGASGVLEGAVTRIRTAGDAVEVDLAAVADQGSAVVEALKHASSGLDFRREIGSILDQAADELARMAGPEAARTDDIAEALEAVLAQIAKLYTMAQERDVHQAMTAALTPSRRKATAPAVQPRDELEDVLF